MLSPPPPLPPLSNAKNLKKVALSFEINSLHVSDIFLGYLIEKRGIETLFEEFFEGEDSCAFRIRKKGRKEREEG